LIDMHVSGKDTDIYLGDCLEVMPKLSNNIACVMTDLPYGTTQNSWDCLIELPLLWQHYIRLSTVNANFLFTASQPFTSRLVISNLPMYKTEWIWLKNIATGHLNVAYMPMKQHEQILVFSKPGSVYNPQREEKLNKEAHRLETRWADTSRTPSYGKMAGTWVNERTLDRGPRSYQCFNVERGLHPTQKPLALMEYFIKTYSNPGDIVLDNCMGSGTTGIACQNTGRKFIGIEKSKKYFEIARKELFNDRPSTEYPFPT